MARAASTGIVTDGDLRRNMTPDLLNRTAGSVMTRAPKTIEPDALASEALEQLNALKITSLFVIDERAAARCGLDPHPRPAADRRSMLVTRHRVR